MIVTWATSQNAAEQAMKRADVLLEAGRWSEAMDALADVERAITETAEFVMQQEGHGSAGP